MCFRFSIYRFKRKYICKALIKQKLKIGSNACIGMGSVVTRNIPDNEIWYGVPAIYKTTI